jgi:hypothetical protein
MVEILSAARTTTGAATVSPWLGVWEWIARPVHYRMVRRLRLAAEARAVVPLQELLSPEVAVVVESTEPDAVGPRVITGRGAAATALVHGMSARPGRRIVERSVNGQAGLLVSDDGRPAALMSIDVTGRLVSVVWIRLHPEVMRRWNRV